MEIKAGEVCYGAETLNGFGVGLTAALEEGTVNVTVWAARTVSPGRNLRGLLGTFEKEASQVGAERLVICGSLADALFNSHEPQALAQKLGYTFKVLTNGSVVLAKRCERLSHDA